MKATKGKGSNWYPPDCLSEFERAKIRTANRLESVKRLKEKKQNQG